MHSFRKSIYKSHKRKEVVILPPTVTARVDKQLSSSESSFFLTATAQKGSGNIVKREWTQVLEASSSSTYNIQNPVFFGSNLTDSDLVANVIELTTNDYTFKIEITDSNGLTASDTFDVTRVFDSIAFEVTNGGQYPYQPSPTILYPEGSFQVKGTTQYYVWLYVQVAPGANNTTGSARQTVSVDIKNINGTLSSLSAQAAPGERVYSSQSILVSQNSTNDVFYIDDTNLWQPFGGFSNYYSGFAYNTINDTTTATDLYVQPV